MKRKKKLQNFMTSERISFSYWSVSMFLYLYFKYFKFKLRQMHNNKLKIALIGNKNKPIIIN